ncbi:hypothetical protein GCM10011600_01080 [Pseudolysinimonas yzui]|uniref:Uncharacterized protein n=1 Tax=Pseudolysinimonas yzui TaxID=2708254 RepID=A0A8J3DZL1_9MICO|nr:hypothetical protein GCM10011600_01080 [Pseudolysinimonas yzui]
MVTTNDSRTRRPKHPRSDGCLQVGERVTEPREPVQVSAWVLFREARIVATAWTERAIRVEFAKRDGTNLAAWVWASAVRRT